MGMVRTSTAPRCCACRSEIVEVAAQSEVEPQPLVGAPLRNQVIGAKLLRFPLVRAGILRFCLSVEIVLKTVPISVLQMHVAETGDVLVRPLMLDSFDASLDRAARSDVYEHPRALGWYT